ncbi:MAG TPA: hypothetical protein VGR41_04975 [Actinomycetota bacterium]|nr:hypothetical protein [Actinomycetota bacterium]
MKDCIAGGDYFCPTDIYVMNSNGTDVTRLTEDPVPEYAVAWSPDGGRIALVRTEGDTNEIDVMNADGTNRIPIVSGTGGNQRPFTWSPDGTQIAFVAVGPESWDIRVIGADGSDNQKIFGQDGVWSEGPVWSPDGTQIAFSSTAGAYPPGCGNSSDVCSDLFVMRSDGSDLVRLTQEANGVHGISWQPIPIDTTPPASPLPGASTEPQYPVPIEGVMALPAQTYIEAGTSVMPLTFPDGAKLELVFPVGIDLSGLGIRASTLGDIGTLDGSGCCARPIELFYGEPSDIPFLGDPVVDVFSGVGGADVLLQKGDPQDGAELYLVYRFGPWTALVYDTWDGMTDAQRQTWAASLEGSVSSEGFLVLQASAPLLLEEARYPMGPKLQIVGPSDRPALSVLPTRCDPELPGQVEVEVFGQAQDAFASWCPAGGVVKMLATGDSELIEALVAGLSAREP